MSGSPRYIFNDDWFHCTAAATAVRPQNNHLLADLKQNCFHSSVLLIWSVSVRTCSEQRGGGADRAGNESPRSFHNCGGGGHKDHNGWAGWLAYDYETLNFAKICFHSSSEDTECSGEGAGDIFSGYLLSSSIVYSVSVCASFKLILCSGKLFKHRKEFLNYVVCDVYKWNGMGGMSLSQFATKLCFQRGN